MLNLPDYEGSVKFVQKARDNGLKSAVVSSSNSAQDVLEAAGIGQARELRDHGADIVVDDLEELFERE